MANQQTFWNETNQAELVKEYQSGRSAAELGVLLNRTTQSIVSKLVQLGVYEKKQPASSGFPKLSKLAAQQMLEAKVGVPLPNSTKLSLKELKVLIDALNP